MFWLFAYELTHLAGASLHKPMLLRKLNHHSMLIQIEDIEEMGGVEIVNLLSTESHRTLRVMRCV